MRALKFGLAVSIGLLGAAFALERPWAITVAAKAIGTSNPCPWPRLIAYPLSSLHLDKLQEHARQDMRVEKVDDTLGIELIHTPTRSFWVKKDGTAMDGRALIGYVIAEQQWIAESAKDYNVRAGDVVVDVGAHVGTFGDDALQRGAAKVIMVEPDPLNVECIRRNFASEIAAGRVVVVAEGAWSTTDSLRFSIGVANSGTGSFVIPEIDHREIEVPVRPLDDMLQSAGISRVDFIKMDIEGAEREALKGAAKTLARWQPRLMLDMYHRSDDAAVLPRVIREANPRYRSYCSICATARQDSDHRIVPYATFFY